MRTCKKCGEEKPLEQFRLTGQKNYRAHECKACTAIRLKAWSEENAATRHRYRKQYYRRNREAIKANVRKWEAEHPEQRKANARVYYFRLQHQCIMAYGGYRCACCGEAEPMFLTIDHVENNGSQHRKELGTLGGAKFYLWLIANHFPRGFQVLCSNCNHGRHRNGGICPHEQGVTTIPKGSTAKRREAHRTPRG